MSTANITSTTNITPMRCVKCGGCPAYGKLLTCLFCEDGEPCPCGGWKKAAAQQPRQRKGKGKRALRERELEPNSPTPSPEMRGQRGHRTRSPEHNAMDSARAPSLAPGPKGVISPHAPPSSEMDSLEQPDDRPNPPCETVTFPLSQPTTPAPEVRLPVRFDGEFLARRLREFYGSRAASARAGAAR